LPFSVAVRCLFPLPFVAFLPLPFVVVRCLFAVNYGVGIKNGYGD